MIEIDEYAKQAVESPVAQPPEMARLVTLANRHRRNLRGVRATLALGLTTVTVAAIVGLTSRSTDNGRLKVTATSPKTASSATTTGSSDTHELTIAVLTDRLSRAGHHVAGDGTASGSPLAAVAHLLCVDDTQVRVYQYANVAARVAVSTGISPDGSLIDLAPDGPSTRTLFLPHWVGPPHFFAKGLIIVLVLQDNDPVLHTIERILGPTLSPRALPRPGVQARCATNVP